MKLGLVSDVHAAPAALAAALDRFEQEAVDSIICAGDIAGYNQQLDACIDLLVDAGAVTIIGNHDQNYLETNTDGPSRNHEYLAALPTRLEFELAGKRILLVHAEPPDKQHGGIKLLDVDGELIPEQKQHWTEQLQHLAADVLIVGHTHQVYAEWLGDVLVINPGSSAYNHSCMVLDLDSMQVHTYGLLDQPVLPSWNWGMLVSGNPA